MKRHVAITKTRETIALLVVGIGAAAAGVASADTPAHHGPFDWVPAQQSARQAAAIATAVAKGGGLVPRPACSVTLCLRKEPPIETVSVRLQCDSFQR